MKIRIFKNNGEEIDIKNFIKKALLNNAEKDIYLMGSVYLFFRDNKQIPTYLEEYIISIKVTENENNSKV